MRFPPASEHPDKPHPEYEIDIFRDWCKSCGICAAFCPRQCLEPGCRRRPGGGQRRALHRLPLVRTPLPGFRHLRPGSGKRRLKMRRNNDQLSSLIEESPVRAHLYVRPQSGDTQVPPYREELINAVTIFSIRENGR